MQVDVCQPQYWAIQLMLWCYEVFADTYKLMPATESLKISYSLSNHEAWIDSTYAYT